MPTGVPWSPDRIRVGAAHQNQLPVDGLAFGHRETALEHAAYRSKDGGQEREADGCQIGEDSIGGALAH